jgi:RNA polymerase sigma-70 factor (ECF subfamily)
MQHPDLAVDAPTWDVLYQRHAPVLFAYLFKQTASREDAEDLLLEVFLAAMERSNLEERSEQEQHAWLWAVARNKAADHFRQRKRHPSAPLKLVEETVLSDAALEPEQVLLKREAFAELFAQIEQLPALQQEVLKLRFGHGLRSAEIAQLLKKKEGAVRMLLSRALRVLRSLSL